MARKRTKHTTARQENGKQSQRTPTFLLELPLAVEEGQAKRLRAHLEAGRQFYNALLSEGQKRLRRMRADPAWQGARAIPRSYRVPGLSFPGKVRRRACGSRTSGYFNGRMRSSRCPEALVSPELELVGLKV